MTDEDFTEHGRAAATRRRAEPGELRIGHLGRRPERLRRKTRAEAAELIARYPDGQSRSALLPMLHLVQSEQGHVTPDGIAFCARHLDLTKAQVAAVATFYTMYKRSPTGEYLVSVCTNTLCGMLGGDEIFRSLSRSNSASAMNETTADGMITLEHAECLAACDYAPVVTVNYEFFDNQTVGLGEHRQQAAGRRTAAAQPGRAAVHVPGDRAADRRVPRRTARGARGRGHRRADRGRRQARDRAR